MLNAIAAGAKLTANGCEMDKAWALVVSPKTASLLKQLLWWFSLADLALKNGYAETLQDIKYILQTMYSTKNN